MPNGEVSVNNTRRSPRVLLRIAISLTLEEDPPEHGLTAVVNQHGALVLSPIQWEPNDPVRTFPIDAVISEWAFVAAQTGSDDPY